MAWMSISQDKEITKLVSVNAALDPILFDDAVYNEADTSKFKISIEAISAFIPDDIDDIWCEGLIFWSWLE